MNYSEIPTDWAKKWAVYSPEKTAFKEYETGREVSYYDLNRMGNRVAQWLTQEQQLRTGDRVVILAENCLEYVFLLVAAQKTGIILVPLNYRLSGPEIAYLLQDADPGLLIVEDQFQEKIESSDRPLISLADFRALTNPATNCVWDDPYPEALRDPSEPVFILYTSGSTGFPKGVLYTHGMLFWNSVNTNFSLKVNTDSRTVSCMPPFHTGGWNVLLTPFFHHGGYTCLMKRFDAEAVVQSLDTEQATMFMGVPTMLKMMAETPAFANARFDSIYYFLVGGEAMPIPLIETWNQKGVPIRQGFGMTECGPNLTSLHHDDAIRMAGSIGRPNFFIQTRIVDESGQDCQPGQRGELLIRGPVVTPGYWNNPTATRKSLQDNWFHTGDLVEERNGGYLYVVDRIKNMFISGGENVYPAEVERVLLTYPGIKEGAVVAIADPKWGEVGKAFLVVEEPEGFDLEGLTAYCKQNLARFKIPKQFVLLTEMPKGDTGKINRKKLLQHPPAAL